MGQLVRADVGPIIIQTKTFGADATEEATTVYTCGSWEFNPGVNVQYLTGPRGVAVTAIPFIGEQMININVQGETSRVIEASRLLGAPTYQPANAARSIDLLSAFQVGNGLKPRAMLMSALEAIGGGAINADATPSVYELRLDLTTAATPAATGMLWRITPTPTRITDTTTVFGTAISDTDYSSFFVAGQGSDGDTAKVIFAINAATQGDVTMLWDRPTIPSAKITVMSGRESGNVFSYVEADDCVPSEATYAQERGTAPEIPTAYRVLGANARFRQVDFAASLAAVQGIA